MGRRAVVNLTPTAFTTTCDLAAILPATDKPCKIVGFRIWNTSDVGDAQEEVLSVSIIRGYTSNGSGGAAATPQVVSENDTVSFTARVGDTTLANTGTTVVPFRGGWNVRVPMDYLFAPEDQIPCSAAKTQIVLRIADTPADSLTVGAAVIIEEMP